MANYCKPHGEAKAKKIGKNAVVGVAELQTDGSGERTRTPNCAICGQPNATMTVA